MKKIVITGSQGCIGSIIQGGLSHHELCLVDIKKERDEKQFVIDIANNYHQLVKVFKGKDAIIHLAWNFFEDFPKETIDHNNKKMAENVYSAAVSAGVKRVIIASSVHANDYSSVNSIQDFDSPSPVPDSPYGASKVYIEALGKYYANYHGLEVVCVRFGGVNIHDVPIFEEDANYDKVLLYKQDCIDLIGMCISETHVPGNFQVFTAVSNNKDRVHQIDNFLNWQPNYPRT